MTGLIPNFFCDNESSPMSEVKVIWLKKVKGRSGTETKRLTGTLVSIHDDYCTVEIGANVSAREPKM
jgi:hypothetical protein